MIKGGPLERKATNAGKYGALSVAKGYVGVRTLAADRRLALDWTEVGSPSIKPPTRSGFGTIVMKALVRDQFKGEMRLDWIAECLACEMVIPT